MAWALFYSNVEHNPLLLLLHFLIKTPIFSGNAIQFINLCCPTWVMKADSTSLESFVKRCDIFLSWDSQLLLSIFLSMNLSSHILSAHADMVLCAFFPLIGTGWFYWWWYYLGSRFSFCTQRCSFNFEQQGNSYFSPA